MPWTAADAKSHKKGLSSMQARAWANIANQALSDCQAKNGSDCEGRAIRIANAAVERVGKALTPATTTVMMKAAIAKTDDVQRRIWGWVNVTKRRNGQVVVDLQGDVIDIYDLADAWYPYVRESGQLNFMHVGKTRGYLIEAMVFTPEKIEALGLAPDALPLGVWAGYEIPDPDDYALLKRLGYFMYSIEGEGERGDLGDLVIDVVAEEVA